MAGIDLPGSKHVSTSALCAYGCNQIAEWQFRNGKFCCSKSYNSCPEKRRVFSQTADHAGNASKSLVSRQRLGVTKSSQIKASKTRKANGHYDRLGSHMKQLWLEQPWLHKGRAHHQTYPGTTISYQGSYEYEFLRELELRYGTTWLVENVKRGPSFTYCHPKTGETKTYLSDFQIGNTVYEIKSSYTWNRNGQDSDLENLNTTKLQSVKNKGYRTVLVLNHKEHVV